MLFELHGLQLNRVNRKVALSVLMSLRASRIVIRIREGDEARAQAILHEYSDKDFSFTDALSFAVMERLGIHNAFSLDRHFAQFGWILISLDEGAR